MPGRDWVAWHQDYADPQSSLSRRLACVTDYLRQAVTLCSDGGRRTVHVTSICAGDGRDVLSVAGEWSAGQVASITLIELDPILAQRATQRARRLPVPVHVRQVDAGDCASYQDVPPADILLACGVFGNIPVDHAKQTIQFLPGLLRPRAVVIWTRGRKDDGTDPSEQIRAMFDSAGFRELAFTAPADARYRVGMNQLCDAGATRASVPRRIFTFAT